MGLIIMLSIKTICWLVLFCVSVEDQERNNGKDKPYFMSDELKKIINVKNQVTPEDVERSKQKDKNIELTDVDS